MFCIFGSLWDKHLRPGKTKYVQNAYPKQATVGERGHALIQDSDDLGSTVLTEQDLKMMIYMVECTDDHKKNSKWCELTKIFYSYIYGFILLKKFC